MSDGWLDTSIDSYLRSLDPNAVAARVAQVRRPWTKSAKRAGKRWISWSLHRRGVAYGLPLARPEMLARIGPGAPDAAFSPFLSIWCDLLLEAEAIARGEPRRQRHRAWLLCGLAYLVGEDALGSALYQLADGTPDNPRLEARAGRVIQEKLRARRYTAGNPLLGLPIRNGFVYSDARLVGRIALEIAAAGVVDPEALSRLRSFANQERQALVAALCALVAHGDRLPRAARRIAATQLQQSGLSREQVKVLRRLLAEPPSAERVARMVESERAASYLLEQVILAATVDGQIDSDERDFITELGARLGLAPMKASRIEWRVRGFCQQHHDLFDLFTQTQYYGHIETVFRERVTRVVLQNLDALVTEIRQTGELAALLTKAGAGQTLSQVEREKVKEQLLDICRAIPSLALFALPGGALLLPLVLRVLPWDLRPSAFRQLDLRDER